MSSVGDEAVEADKMTATIKGPASEITADLFFAKDAAARRSLSRYRSRVGKFSMELAR